jgi:hypothetical protein
VSDLQASFLLQCQEQWIEHKGPGNGLRNPLTQILLKFYVATPENLIAFTTNQYHRGITPHALPGS